MNLVYFASGVIFGGLICLCFTLYVLANRKEKIEVMKCKNCKHLGINICMCGRTHKKTSYVCLKDKTDKPLDNIDEDINCIDFEEIKNE